MSALTLGFIPLTDCAPLVVAQAKGFFAAEGLDVTLSREASWATIRDKVAVGALDAAHMLAPMALAATLGAGGEPTALIAPLALNRNGSGVTVSIALAEALRAADPQAMAETPVTARALAKLIAQRRAASAPPLTFAVVFPYSIHNYALRYWMSQAGVDPDRDVRIVVTPPPRMVEQLAAGVIDGFCVGAPWNAVARAEGVGEVLLRASDFWRNGPDKVFGMTRTWAEAHPETLQSALRALISAAAWADDPAHRPELVALLAQPEHVGADPQAIAWALQGEIVFHAGDAGFPWLSHAAWFLSQMARWGQIPPGLDLTATAAAVYRPDLYRQAAGSLGLATPAADTRIEGPQAFFDGLVFDPASAQAYARDFPIGRLSG
ncbi:CmpA/NrtA family ABC transporter substrate-binding protein [Phenylobacterium aquaticum]|uniref:CmpA/NrtA family ABC transporter substrate-binding protein n=1 Tax=Phenylobacterium aquaticum TaxID=1763816 RepID=UPI0026F3507D|nr:CmpA/NrtA family ABC transporter substrate-binding protein [Phenylobacterium aquaticum]